MPPPVKPGTDGVAAEPITRETLSEAYSLVEAFGFERDELQYLTTEITRASLSDQQELRTAVIRKVSAALLGEPYRRPPDNKRNAAARDRGASKDRKQACKRIGKETNPSRPGGQRPA